MLNLTRKRMLKDWGKKCKSYAPLCGSCVAWHAWETLEDLYEVTK